MKLLFISMSARVIIDYSGKVYLNSHMNRKTIKRYADICDEFCMILRDSNIRCSEEEAKKRYNLFPNDLAQLSVCYNPFVPKTNLINMKKYKQLNIVFNENIKWADKVIIASAVGFYSEIAIRCCKKFHRDYMLLVGGFAFETDWNHGLDGKLVALKHEYQCRKNISEALYVLYVTQETLQKRYPCPGKTIGCSDVEVTDLNPDILKRRLERIEEEKTTFVLGTIANVDDKQKGHRLVVKAISLLKQMGYRFQYRLLGGGYGDEILEFAKQCGVENQVFIDGVKPHNEVYSWLDDIDIYIQPSFAEGLCRAVVEAMSRACPVICTNAGGNVELCSKNFLTRVGSYDDIVEVLENMISVETRKKQAEISFERAHEYYYEKLDKKRRDFLLEFMR